MSTPRAPPPDDNFTITKMVQTNGIFRNSRIQQMGEERTNRERWLGFLG
mgnify:CR=1 FL=1